MDERLAALAAPYRLFIGPQHPLERQQQQAHTDFIAVTWELERILAPLAMDMLLEKWRQEWKTDKTVVAASLLVKSFARTLIAAWRLLSAGNHALDLRGMRIIHTAPNTVAIWIPDPEAVQPLPADPAERAAARDRWLREAAQGYVRPMLEAVAFRSGLPLPVAWENVYIYLHHGYGEWIRSAETPEERARIEDDFAALTAAGSAFRLPDGGSFPDPAGSGRELRIRRTCCLKSQLPNGTPPCYSCPMIENAERIAILTQKKSP